MRTTSSKEEGGKEGGKAEMGNTPQRRGLGPGEGEGGGPQSLPVQAGDLRIPCATGQPQRGHCWWHAFCCECQLHAGMW